MNTSTVPPISIGTPVLTADGSRVGDVVDVASHYFVVEKGLLLTTDLHLPLSAVDGTDEDGVRLALTDAELEAGDWALPPAPDVPVGRDRPSDAPTAGGGMPRYVGAGMNGENGYDHHALLKKPDRLSAALGSPVGVSARKWPLFPAQNHTQPGRRPMPG